MTQITSDVVGEPTHMADLVVVGSGTAGITAAPAASVRGLDPLVIEKTDVAGGSLRLCRSQLRRGSNSNAIADTLNDPHP